MKTDRINEAFSFANWVHCEQVRKGSGVPYISHLLVVASMVMENGGSEDAFIAALLHDTLEDRSDWWHRNYGTDLKNEIKDRFGEKVLSLVLELTETEEDPKPPWKTRKIKYLFHLERASEDALLIAICDKIHNTKSTRNDIKLFGKVKAFEKFNSDIPSQIWWLDELHTIFSAKAYDSKIPHILLEEFEDLVIEIGDLV